MTYAPVIETERLILHRFSVEDAVFKQMQIFGSCNQTGFPHEFET